MRLVDALEQKRIVVIIRKVYGEQLMSLAKAMMKGGIHFLEVTFDQSDSQGKEKTGQAIRQLREQFADSIYVGAGTVLTAEQVRVAYASGAQFIISPNTDSEVVQLTKELNLISIPGAMTPSEILYAHRLGADFIKVFPAIDLGLGYIKNIRAPISHVKLLATAGINEDNFLSYLKAGYAGAGISGRLTDPALLHTGRYDELTRRAQAFCRVVDQYHHLNSSKTQVHTGP